MRARDAVRRNGRPAGAGMKARALPPVSVVVPARDAEATLAAALDSVLAQDYAGGFEVIVADGSEGAATGELLRRRFPGVRVVANPGRGIGCGLNRALAAARHRVIVRCDARAVLPAGYLTRAVATLERTGAANVGGRVNPVGSTFFERAAALATATPLGAGDARYRVGGPEGPVDTVFPGVFRRDAVEAAGGYDEGLLRNEDYELNWRLRARGGTVWFDPALAVEYRPRGSFRALARQYYGYGRWKRAMLARHPRSLKLRQALPPLLLAALVASAALAAAGGSGAFSFGSSRPISLSGEEGADTSGLVRSRSSGAFPSRSRSGRTLSPMPSSAEMHSPVTASSRSFSACASSVTSSARSRAREIST